MCGNTLNNIILSRIDTYTLDFHCWTLLADSMEKNTHVRLFFVEDEIKECPYVSMLNTTSLKVYTCVGTLYLISSIIGTHTSIFTVGPF